MRFCVIDMLAGSRVAFEAKNTDRNSCPTWAKTVPPNVVAELNGKHKLSG